MQYMEKKVYESNHNSLYSKLSSPNKTYHYATTANTLNLLKIWQASEQKAREDEIDYSKLEFEIWASHLSFLNDAEEFQNGQKILVSNLKEFQLICQDDIRAKIDSYIQQFNNTNIFKINESTRDYFIVCFCEEGNLLSQWKYYGKKSGIAIEYDLSDCLISGFASCKIDESKYPRIRNVVYEDKAKKEKIQNILNKLNDLLDRTRIEDQVRNAMRILHSMLPYFKNSNFQEERESRIIFPLVYDETVHETEQVFQKHKLKQKVNYRENQDKIKPYIKIRFRSKKNVCPIKSLTVGPGADQVLVYEAFKKFLETKFPDGKTDLTEKTDADFKYVTINGIRLNRSLIPFRD